MEITKLIASLALCYLVAFVGNVVTLPAIGTWYVALNKPFFTPPNWLFGPVWILLYTFMAISLFLVWKKGLQQKKVKRAVIVFLFHLALNLLWSLVFFGGHLLFVGFIVIVALWASILYTMLLFRKIAFTAYLLLIPYLAWVSFATLLNLFLVLLN